ncbi:hypothetical protein POM88_008589 [Heracleum sosnowskyi]|uniref:Uncharacterized protein n=1 Tax=Heracleum sosnowskyi TaxID=360622 RepID=A0AAD8J9R4_9APIA|nr:hypothetical protein POM88_054900 [Heracleum sosnowskyi]KAK1398726.1 hypothetical protein POM88_008589 [Heracleum sosnowskyi]
MVYGMDDEFSSNLGFRVLGSSSVVCTFKLPEKLQMEKVMSLNITKIILDFNLRDGICQTNTHQMELSDEDVSIELTAPISGDGTNDLNLPDGQTNTHQMELSDEDVSIELMAPIGGDGPISGDGADTERHQVEVPALDAGIGFTAPISRDVDHANGVADVAGAVAPANTEKLLFEKHRHLWEVAESFEACRKMPQDPHFLPLKSGKENCEGTALGKMVIFYNIAQKTSNLHLDTEREAIMDDLSLLEELETHGFDVALLENRLNKILCLKSQQEKLVNMLEQRKGRLRGHDQKKCKNKEKKAKIEERMKELQKETELAAKMDKENDAKIAAEQQAQRVHGEELHRIKIQFEELVASLLH